MSAPAKLPASVRAQVRRILDREARRLLEERLKREDRGESGEKPT
jgi:hypothetical protein